MDKSIKSAYATAKVIVKKIEKNKVTSFQNKLITAITTKDYDGFNTILLKLSSYAEVELNFAYDLFKDFESNKNLAYTFVNALRVSNNDNKEKINE